MILFIILIFAKTNYLENTILTFDYIFLIIIIMIIKKNYSNPAISEEIVLEMDNKVLAGANSVSDKDLSVVHESAEDVVPQTDWNAGWSQE